MKEVIAMIGIPGSGKSTRAHELAGMNDANAVIICRDTIREELFGPNYKITKARESEVTKKKYELILEAFMDENIGKIIIDETHCSNKTRQATVSDLIKASKASNDEFKFNQEIVETSFDVDKCHKQNTNRPRSVPFQTIEQMHQNFIDYIRETSSCPEWLPKKHKTSSEFGRCYIVDIDGTIADHHGLRSPFEWMKVDLDTPKQHVIDIVNMLYRAGNKVIIFSGRDGECYDLTESWLKVNGVLYDELYLRSAGDMRKDYIVKMELFQKHVMGKYTPVAVFDDRMQVVRYWRAIGIPVFQVELGLF